MEKTEQKEILAAAKRGVLDCFETRDIPSMVVAAMRKERKGIVGYYSANSAFSRLGIRCVVNVAAIYDHYLLSEDAFHEVKKTILFNYSCGLFELASGFNMPEFPQELNDINAKAESFASTMIGDCLKQKSFWNNYITSLINNLNL